ncbi:hypothetical protein SDC9_89437 [bioreactor metagenome]|uniref:Uncharacterized protein n=1 Tax=bioreactor metagenome TaxID=1076179 RepID=A0A644ZPT2_9ZZZZ
MSSGGSDIYAIKQGGYAFNDNKEVTITQKAKVGDSAKTDSPVRAAIMKEEIVKDGKDKKAEPAKQITAAKDDDKVEGEGSKEELQEVDDSLDESESSPESGKE